MKKSMIAIVTAGVMTAAGAAQADDFTYLSGGIYDVYDSDVYVEGSMRVNPNLVLNLQLTNVGDLGLYAGGKYFVDFGQQHDINTFIQGGVSHYDFGAADDTGVYAGAGFATKFDSFSTLIVDARYDTMFDGFASVGARFRYEFVDNLSGDAGVRVNTNDMDNEVRVGLTYNF